MAQIRLSLVCLLLGMWSIQLAISVTVEFKHEYFTDVTLVCDETALNLPMYTTFKKYWILPNGNMLQWSHTPDRKHIVGDGPEFNLTIKRIGDENFGWYYCIVLWDDYIWLTHSIKIGLNVHGADYSDLLEGYRDSAVIGGIAGSSTAIVMALCCLVYWCRFSEVNTQKAKPKEPKPNNKYKFKVFKNGKKPKEKISIVDDESMDEKEAIYVLDKAVKAYDADPTNSYDDSGSITENENSLIMGLQLELKRRSLAMANEISKYEIPIPPPPPPMPIFNHVSKSAGNELDTYDKVPPQRTHSGALLVEYENGSSQAENSAEENECSFGHPWIRNGFINSGFETDVRQRDMNKKSVTEEQGVDVLDSYMFQENIADEYM